MYLHAWESVLSYCDLSDLSRAARISSITHAAVQSMKRACFPIICNLERLRQMCAPPLPPRTSTTALMTRHIHVKGVGLFNEMCIQESIEYASQHGIQISAITISDKRMKDSRVWSLLRVLERQTCSIHTLKLYGSFGDPDVIILLSKALKVNTSITTLSLARSIIGIEESDCLSEMFRTNRSMTSVDLTQCRMGDIGVALLVDGLKVNTSVQSLCLQHNGIGRSGAICLMDLLYSNTSITSVNVGRNKLGNPGVAYIAEALKVNRTLKQLILKSNHIDSNGAQLLAEVLTVYNTTMTALHLQYNQISDEEAFLSLENMLQVSLDMTELCLGGNTVNHTPSMTRISTLLSSRRASAMTICT